MPESAESAKQAFRGILRDIPPYAIRRPDLASVDRLREIANTCSQAGDHFAAGYILQQCTTFAWGDIDVTTSCSVAAIKEFQEAIEAPGAQPLEQVASLWMCLNEIAMTGSWLDPDDSMYRSVRSAIAHALMQIAGRAEDATAREGFLIRGFLLTTDFDGNWSTEFPELEIQGASMSSAGGTAMTLGVVSAFRYYIDSGDYVAAGSIASQCPEAFTTPGLRGWRAGVSGFLNQGSAVATFADAAAELALDLPTEARQRVGLSWNSSNRDLWSKYFLARSIVAEIITSPSRADEWLGQAQESLKGTESGWTHPQVICFRIILKVLAHLLKGDADGEASLAKKALLESRYVLGWDESRELIVDFLDLVDDAFSELRREPAAVVLSTGVRDALTALGRVPLVGNGIATAITPTVVERTFAGLMNQSQGWMYRTLESIRDERTLQHLILRLMQGRLPFYAQIRQGPLEYGKDIAVLAEDHGVTVLEMYQVKAGNINVPVWRTARSELEEIFLVELSDVQLSVEPERREGILIFNGHLNTNVEAPVAGWLEEQARDHNRTFKIMHLDLIVDWITRKGLVNELRRGLAELNIPVLE